MWLLKIVKVNTIALRATLPYKCNLVRFRQKPEFAEIRSSFEFPLENSCFGIQQLTEKEKVVTLSHYQM